jgi:hypothetical protein
MRRRSESTVAARHGSNTSVQRAEPCDDEPSNGTIGMIERLKRIVARLRSSGTWLSPPASPPEDPEIAVPEPKWRRPSGGITAAAVAEPDDQLATIAVTGTTRRAEASQG